MANNVRASRTRGKVMIEGPLRVGSDVLLSGNAMRGDVQLVKRIPISADGSYTFRLPASNIVDILLRTNASPLLTVTSGAESLDVRIGTTTQDTNVSNITVSAGGTFTATLSAPNTEGVVSGQTFFVDVTTVATANNLTAALYVRYQQIGSAD